MNRIIKFVPRPYRSSKIRKAREIEAEKTFARREAIAEEQEKKRKEKEEKDGLIPPDFSNLGEAIDAGISTTDI